MRNSSSDRTLSILALASLIWLTFTIGCSRSEFPKPSAEDVLATDFGGEVRVADLDAFVMGLAADRRSPPKGTDSAEWIESELRKLLVERAVVTEAARNELKTDAAFQTLLQMRIDEGLAGFAGQRLVPPLEIDEPELRREFEAMGDKLARPERRAVYHVLIGVPAAASDAQRDEARGRAKTLRNRVFAGESFEAIARANSDSTTAPNGGFIGAVVKDQINAKARRVIFSLTPGIVSDVVAFDSGYQFFLVKEIIPAYEPKFEEVRRKFVESKQAQHRLETLETFLKESLIAEEIDLNGVDLSDASPQTVLLTVRGQDVRLGNLSAQRGPLPQRLRAAVLQILLVDTCQSRWPEEAARIREDVTQDRVRRELLRRSFTSYVDNLDESRFVTFYERNRSQFVSDPMIELNVFWVALDRDRPTESVARARRLAAQLRAGEFDDQGIEIEHIAYQSMRDLARSHASLVTMVPSASVTGDVYGPKHIDGRLAVVRVESTAPSSPLTFAQAREDLPREMKRLEGARLDREWREQVLSSSNAHVFQENVGRYGAILLNALIGDG